jgi:hypothetical protein
MASVGQELLNAPFPELVKQLGVGIAQAQFSLDQVSIKIAQLMAGFRVQSDGTVDADEDSLVQLEENGTKYSLLALGFTPSFYQFTETIIDLKMSISMTHSRELDLSVEANGLRSASVTASYSQKYQYSAEGSSSMRTKLVVLPPPTALERRLRALLG